MPRSVAQPLPPMEVKSLHRRADPREDAVKELHHVPLRMAKARAGAAFAAAIGDDADKTYGHEGLVSGLKSGEKVPDYFARIVENAAARRRFALALLTEDDTVEVRTVVTFKAS